MTGRPCARSSERYQLGQCSLWSRAHPVSSSPQQVQARGALASAAQPQCCSGPRPSLRTWHSNSGQT
eukprot:56620-Alexandrium_andersonii.AAC.1